MFYNLPVSRFGYRQTEMKHNKFKTNKLTTAAWTKQSYKAENDKTSKKGFLWNGSDGVDHVAREVLQIGAPPSLLLLIYTAVFNSVLQLLYTYTCT